MRYQLLASDYDGTLANQGLVSPEIVEKLRGLQATGRKIVLVTGREMKDLVLVFPEYKVFDYIVAENGAVIHHPATGEEKLLGRSPGAEFVLELQRKGVHPLSVGKVIVATWVPHEQAVLDVIKASGSEYQVIFNKGAVMILPPGINKATGLLELLRQLRLSPHNCVGVGDAENDSSLLQVTEAAVAVNNALPALKGMADWVTPSGHGKGVAELIDAMINEDLSSLDERMTRHYPDLGTLPDGGVFTISPWRSGILVAGASGSGKTTLTISIIESLIRKEYQFCLIDPEGDYLELPGATIVGDETSLPPIEEIRQLLKEPRQNLVICTLSVPLHDRPACFMRLLDVLVELRREYSRPHWLIMDEAHHLVPGPSEITDHFPADFNNFIIISTSPHALHASALAKIGMIISIGENSAYPFEQFGQLLQCEVPTDIPKLAEGEICVWERGGSLPPFVVRYNQPHQLLQRHKKKYAQGDMGYNSFIFTGEERRLNLVANNLLLFLHIAEGVDIETWLYHLCRKDFTNWFRNTIHDEDLAKVGEEAEKMKDAGASRRHVLDFIAQKYTG